MFNFGREHPEDKHDICHFITATQHFTRKFKKQIKQLKGGQTLDQDKTRTKCYKTALTGTRQGLNKTE